MKNKIISIIALVSALASCATVDAAQPIAGASDPFAGKNWNAPRRNNMYDRWEFDAGGAFHFWHVHMGTPLDRGVYQYEAKDGIITITKAGTDETSAYTYRFNGKTVTLTPIAGRDAAGRGHHLMGALPETETSFALAK